jgi:hypothetical protein
LAEKAEDWRDEQEFRWLAANDTAEPIFVNYSGALSAIVFGQDCPEADVRAAVAVLSNGLARDVAQVAPVNNAE